VVEREYGGAVPSHGDLQIERLHGPSLVLEPLQVEHAEEMAPLLNDPALHSFIGGSPETLAELVQRYARQVRGHSPDGSQQWLNWIVRRVDTGEAVGTGAGDRLDPQRIGGSAQRGARLGHHPAPPTARLCPRSRADRGDLVA